MDLAPEKNQESHGQSGGSGMLLRMEGIGKSFSGVRVLSKVKFDLCAGEVHILAGENGAGKSTLIKILAGVHSDYEGTIWLKDRQYRFRSPQEAYRNGISVIYQEISLVGPMSVAENIFLGREKTRWGFWTDRSYHFRKAREILSGLGLDIDVARPVQEYPVSVQQMVEITKALSLNSRIIVMDEPTSTLSEPEVERLFAIIGVLKSRGCGIIYITHKMEEIYRLADRITVLRDGEYVGTADAARLPQGELIRWMVGREIKEQFPQRTVRPGREILEVRNFSICDKRDSSRLVVENVSFRICAGEIVGFAGLQGSGNSELLGGLFGRFGRPVAGEVLLDGCEFRISSPGNSIASGLALLTNNRKAEGIIPEMNITRNITLAALDKFSPGGWLRPELEEAAGAAQAGSLQVKSFSLDQEVGTLSGGNQQKVILAKWLETRPKVLLLDEPTRGVDVAVKHEIYELMNRWTEAGCAVLVITSEMPELLAMADRILVMYRGHLAAELSREEATQERILQAAMGETE